MDIKTLAAGMRRLQNDESFCYIIESIKKDQANIFFNPHSSIEDREESHTIIRALNKIESRLAQVLADEAIFDKKQ